jgi:hypothetical protein
VLKVLADPLAARTYSQLTGRSKGQKIQGRSSSHPDHHQQGNDAFQTKNYEA